MSKSRPLPRVKNSPAWQRYLPCSDWLFHYRKRDWPGDVIAGVIVAVMLIPQGMAYALLAGLPPAVGLYASILPPSHPHMAVVGRIPGTEHFRNVKRHRVITQPHILTIRVDESLYFANTKYLEDHLQLLITEKPELESLVLVCSAVNFIDASALESLECFGEDLKEAGVELYLAEVKGPVMDQLERGGFLERMGRDRVFLTPHDAMIALTEAAA